MSSGKTRSVVAILSISILISIVAGLIHSAGWSDSIEKPTADLCVGWRYRLKKKLDQIHVSSEVVLVGVDQKSVDPAVSVNSDRWGSGGWLSRDHWINALPHLIHQFKPSVVAYDVLFLPYRQAQSEGKLSRESPEAVQVNRYLLENKEPFFDLIQTESFPRVKLLDLLDEACNSNFATRFFDAEDARSTGTAVPHFITAYTLTSKDIELAKPWDTANEADREKIDALRLHQIPASCLHQIPSDYPYSDNAGLPFDLLVQSPIHLGFINVPRDPDGHIRRIPLVLGFRDPTHNNEPVFVPSLALQACLLHLGIDPSNPSSGASGSGISIVFGKEIHLWTPKQKIHVPIDSNGNFFLNFEGTIHDFLECPYVAVTDYGNVLKEESAITARGDERSRKQLKTAREIQKQLKDKVALIGVTFTGATDVGPCAIDRNTPFVFIHMTAIDNILRQSFLSPMGFVPSLALISLLPILTGFVQLRSRATHSGWGILLLLLGFELTAFGLFYFNIAQIPMAVPGLSILVSFGVISLYRYMVEQKGRIEIRKKFTTMVSGKVLQYLEEHPESFSLRGEKRTATMFFSDVAGFTSISEKLPPAQLGEALNDYLTPMTELILKGDGYLNKYAGDGIMAVWGVPYPSPDHAIQACLAALEQQKKIQEIQSFFDQKHGIHLKVRMGLNSGIVSAGMMGSREKKDYTVMGDAVNLAARLEPANKDYDTLILIGQNTYELAKEAIEARLLDRIIVQGKTEPIQIYELLARKGELSSSWIQALPLFQDGLLLYWNQQWEKALEKFQSVLQLIPNDPPSKLFMRRTRDFQLNPPAFGWKGEYIRSTKN